MILPSPTDRPLQAGLMTTTFAVLIVEVLKQFFPAQDFRYKWVNDIYLNHKKVGGILTEAVVDLELRTTASLVVGIGLNALSTNLPMTPAHSFGPAMLPVAISRGAFLKNTVCPCCTAHLPAGRRPPFVSLRGAEEIYP